MKLKCVKCGEEYELVNIGKCPRCGGILFVEGYNYHNIEYKSDLKGIGKYKNLLPIENYTISLGEGNTPIVNSISNNNLFFKMESQNPSGSFKDRGTAVMVNKAKEMEINHIVIASSGNAAASVSTYAAKSKIKVTVIIPMNIPEAKINQSLYCGAEVLKLEGDFTCCYNKSIALASKISL